MRTVETIFRKRGCMDSCMHVYGTFGVDLPSHARVVDAALARLRGRHEQLRVRLLVQGLQEPT